MVICSYYVDELSLKVMDVNPARAYVSPKYLVHFSGQENGCCFVSGWEIVFCLYQDFCLYFCSYFCSYFCVDFLSDFSCEG